MSDYKFETLQLHVGQEQADPATDSRAVPIYQTTSYVFRNSQHAADRFGLADAGNIYGRLTNSTEDVFEKRIAALEGGVAALAVASGAAAIDYTLQALAQNGGHIVAQKTIYGGTSNLLAHTLPAFGVQTTFVNAHDLAEVEAAIQDNTRAVYIETLGNPNADATSQILAAGDGAEKGLVFSSGMAAITTSILATVKPGDHIVASPIIYGEAFYYLKYELKRWGVETTFIDFNTQDVADYIRPNTKLVYGETIANPLMSVPDIQHLADVAHANGAKLFIDNTFATSIIAKPIKYGADLVIYSATKYLGGHDDLVGGAVVGSEEIIKSLSFYLGLYGANLGATESWLLARSLRTLPLRVKKMAENGLALAKFFESHPKVEKVYYPGLESSPSKALADKQFEGNGYGGMLCVNFKGGQKEIDKLISNLQLVRFVPTLAGVGTTLTYPPRASHRDLSPDELAAIGITMGQIRLSSGLEDTDDLLNDFDQALAKM